MRQQNVTRDHDEPQDRAYRRDRSGACEHRLRVIDLHFDSAFNGASLLCQSRGYGLQRAGLGRQRFRRDLDQPRMRVDREFHRSVADDQRYVERSG